MNSNNERSQNKTNFAAVVASYNTRPGNEVGSFYRGVEEETKQPSTRSKLFNNNGNIIFNDTRGWNELPCHVKSAPSLRSSVVV